MMINDCLIDIWLSSIIKKWDGEFTCFLRSEMTEFPRWDI